MVITKTQEVNAFATDGCNNYQDRLNRRAMATAQDLAVKAEVVAFLHQFRREDGSIPARQLAEEWGGITHAALITAYAKGIGIGAKLENLVARLKFGGSIDRLREHARRAWEANEYPPEIRRKVEFAATGDVVETKGAAIGLMEREIDRLNRELAEEKARHAVTRAQLARGRDANDARRRATVQVLKFDERPEPFPTAANRVRGSSWDDERTARWGPARWIKEIERVAAALREAGNRVPTDEELLASADWYARRETSIREGVRERNAARKHAAHRRKSKRGAG